jgi:hypothetical protein
MAMFRLVGTARPRLRAMCGDREDFERELAAEGIVPSLPERTERLRARIDDLGSENPATLRKLEAYARYLDRRQQVCGRSGVMPSLLIQVMYGLD